jgi:peptidyl-prolyl cis-trans isomerase C
MRSLVLTIVLSAALVLSATGCSKKSKEGSAAGASGSLGSGAGAVVAKVDGKNVTALDVQRQENILVQQMQSYADSAQIAAMGPGLRKQAFDNAINRVLLDEALVKLGIKVDKKTIDDRVDTYRKNFVSDEAYQADLAKRGMTQDQLRHEVEVGSQAEELFDRRTASLKPTTEQEARTFYDGNKERFVTPERVRASHILLTVNKDDSDAVRAQKKAEAERILGELKKGADFADEAKKYSGCPSKDQGGDLGYFERGRMVPPFEKAAFALKPGQMSGVVETEFGYHIIKVTDRTPASTVPFDQAKDQIEQYLTQQKKQQALVAYFDSLRAASQIEVMDSSYVR